MTDEEKAPRQDNAQGSEDCHSRQGDNQEDTIRSKREQRKVDYFNSAASGWRVPNGGWPFGLGPDDTCDTGDADYNRADAQADALCELEQHLLGWQIKGEPGAVQ